MSRLQPQTLRTDVVLVSAGGPDQGHGSHPLSVDSESHRPWQKLRGSAELEMEPEDSVLYSRAFEALR